MPPRRVVSVAAQAGRDILPLSCKRCRKRKIRCNRKQPCDKCITARVECVKINEGEKRRPISTRYVRALEGHVAWLEILLEDLGRATAQQRDEMLREHFKKTGRDHLVAPNEESSLTTSPAFTKNEPVREVSANIALRVHGATSSTTFITIDPSLRQDDATGITDVQINPQAALVPPISTPERDWEFDVDDENKVSIQCHYSPRSTICQQLMAAFFHHQYTDHMCLYREFFIRDYNSQSGPHYSVILMYAVCAMGALVKGSDFEMITGLTAQELSEYFAKKAQALLYEGALDSPNLTTLQALLLLGHRDIGMGNSSKGWAFTGIAFRLAHEMGLHLDPDRWKTAQDSEVEREILRRVYWAAFVADKQLSLYFGRLPALRLSEGDVNATVRICYPPEWNSLLQNYIQKDTNENEYEDGPNLVRAFIQQVELSKIVYTMITEVFENGKHTNDTVQAVAARATDTALEKWLDDLPNTLHWNMHTRGDQPSYIIHLHLFFHTVMIVLHRPPRQASPEYLASAVEDLEICNQSVESILKLLRFQRRSGLYSQLPAIAVHTLASAASVILLKLYMDGPALLEAENETSSQLEQVLEAIDGISATWTSAKQIRQMVDQAVTSIKMIHEDSQLIDWDWENNLMENSGMPWLNSEEDWAGLVGPEYL